MEENKTNNLPVPVCNELQELLPGVDFLKFKSDLTAIIDPITEAFRRIGEAFAQVTRVITMSMAEFAVQLEMSEWVKAYCWALDVHPKWARIYDRTKKRRIKKKYRDRILRAYRAEMAKQEADCGL